jgi:hypothetical protein
MTKNTATYFCDFKNTRFELRGKGGRDIIRLGYRSSVKANGRTVLQTHFAPQGRRIPSQKSVKPAGLGAKELRMSVLQVWWQVVAGEIIENVD